MGGEKGRGTRRVYDDFRFGKSASGREQYEIKFKK